MVADKEYQAVLTAIHNYVKSRTHITGDQWEILEKEIGNTSLQNGIARQLPYFAQAIAVVCNDIIAKIKELTRSVVLAFVGRSRSYTLGEEIPFNYDNTISKILELSYDYDEKRGLVTLEKRYITLLNVIEVHESIQKNVKDIEIPFAEAFGL